jgi:riboflavin kinase
LKGKVFSGKGEGTEFLNFPWVRKQIEEKLGFAPYPGTLNVGLFEDSVNLRKRLEWAKGMEILSEPGFCRGRLFEACLMGTVVCGVIIPDVAGYPEDVIELVASVNLRERLQLSDGDLVDVKIMF